MKHYIHYVCGYLGYFLLALVSIRFQMANDMTGFILTWVGLMLLITYVEFMEKKSDKPKYSGYIKFGLSVVFLLTTLGFIYDFI
ncbi:hypothetical protein JI666_09525 [Bacillus sp. NTK071]|uniref:hypothetical protein n=1 Tax=Bacillus sp. NTK071 TaxID=2802175 RepID=UPI001A8E0970|nr:hypothetical protein [Bacillus sp. NTK071]MBN8208983.1 hypothetical protein [Bacillus sp. NTK071]